MLRLLAAAPAGEHSQREFPNYQYPPARSRAGSSPIAPYFDNETGLSANGPGSFPLLSPMM